MVSTLSEKYDWRTRLGWALKGRTSKRRCAPRNVFVHSTQPQRTLEGIEAVNMMRKGQVKRLAGSDAQGQAKFVVSLFQVAA